jgi:hypothetical protein
MGSPLSNIAGTYDDRAFETIYAKCTFIGTRAQM